MIRDEENLTNADYEALYKELIIESDDTDAARRQSVTLKSLPDDAHFGILEQYYSALINPNRHSIRFWKLVNFYWSAFFSIALPITDGFYGKLDSYNKNRHTYVLSHLNEAVHKMFDPSHVNQRTSADCYYSVLHGKFDMVVTTNYTPYGASIVDCNNSRIACLGGRLSQFERFPEFEYVDYSNEDRDLEDNACIFPYLLCQSPVKPVISIAQIDEFAKAARALRDADEIVVLGYSFCNEDAHISSMVGEALRDGCAEKLTYFSYWPDSNLSFDRTAASAGLARKLRVTNESATEKIEVAPVTNCRSHEFVSRCEEWTV